MSKMYILIHFLSFTLIMMGLAIIVRMEDAPLIMKVTGMLMMITGGSGVFATYLKEE